MDWGSHLEVLWEQPFMRDLLASLARFSRVLWFDMRGVGLSDRLLDAPMAPEDWMEDVAAVMDASGSEHASVASGHILHPVLGRHSSIEQAIRKPHARHVEPEHPREAGGGRA